MAVRRLLLLWRNTVDLEHVDLRADFQGDHREPASVFAYDLPIISRHDGQKQDVISEGDDVLSLADDHRFKVHKRKVSVNVDADLLV